MDQLNSNAVYSDHSLVQIGFVFCTAALPIYQFPPRVMYMLRCQQDLRNIVLVN